MRAFAQAFAQIFGYCSVQAFELSSECCSAQVFEHCSVLVWGLALIPALRPFSFPALMLVSIPILG